MLDRNKVSEHVWLHSNCARVVMRQRRAYARPMLGAIVCDFFQLPFAVAILFHQEAHTVQAIHKEALQ